ncbi:MAG: SH3 domain-containing protein [Chloroflexota bacterium]
MAYALEQQKKRKAEEAAQAAEAARMNAQLRAQEKAYQTTFPGNQSGLGPDLGEIELADMTERERFDAYKEQKDHRSVFKLASPTSIHPSDTVAAGPIPTSPTRTDDWLEQQDPSWREEKSQIALLLSYVRRIGSATREFYQQNIDTALVSIGLRHGHGYIPIAPAIPAEISRYPLSDAKLGEYYEAVRNGDIIDNVVFAQNGLRMYTARSVNVRAGAGIDASILVTLEKDVLLTWSGIARRDDGGNLWFKVLLDDHQEGWIYSPFLTRYIPELARPGDGPSIVPWIFSAPNPTALPNQFITYTDPNLDNDIKATEVGYKTNLCGYFCAAFIANIGIHDIIQEVRTNLPTDYRNYIIPNKTHPIDAVVRILNIYGFECREFSSSMYDSISNSQIITPGSIKRNIDAGNVLVAGVVIDGSGRLVDESRIGHWVVVTDVILSGTDAWVDIYNPYNNQREFYSYKEFMASFYNSQTGNARGVWVRRR